MDVDENVNEVYPYEGDLPFLFPNEKTNPLNGYITLDNVNGREYTCMLISTYPLKVKEIASRIKKSKGTFTQRLYHTLGGLLLPLDNVKYGEGDQITFEGKLREREILPIMLEMEHGRRN